MRIGIVGSGISGLTCAYLLARNHDVHVFESGPTIGGHTATKDVSVEGQNFSIDTGFIVFNDRNYPNFSRLMDEIGVSAQNTDMSFSVSCEQSGLEYGGSNLNTLFAQRRNLFKPTYYKMLWEITRFNKEAVQDIEQHRVSDALTLGEYLAAKNYDSNFINKYLIPMGCAIWSASTQTMLDFPLLFFVQFFKNHGLLSLQNRPQWKVIQGGSKSYLAPLTQSFKDQIYCNNAVTKISRNAQYTVLQLADNSLRTFDHVVLACHSNEALALLSDKTLTEQRVLESIPYQKNEVILHTDENLLPRNRLAWSSWNYRLKNPQQEQAVLTYNMNILQGINSAPATFCVTLNATEDIQPEKILGRYHYSHPVFSLDSEAAKKRWDDINGTKNTWFCGAYWGNGFHEDGASSGIRVAQALGAEW